MIKPAVVDPIPQLSTSDCAVRCLAQLLEMPYADVLAAIPPRVKPKKDGLTERQIIGAAKRLGFVVRAREGKPEDDEFGILDLYKKEGRRYAGHVALHMDGGHVVDPADGLIYTDVDAFLKAKGWTIQGFYWRES